MYYDKNTTIFLNKQWLKAKDATTGLYQQSFHYGNGVFEGMRAYKTPNGAKVLKVREHFERLLYSAEKMYINLEYTVDELVSICYELLEKNNMQDAYIRPLVYTDENMGLQPESNANLFMCAWKWGQYYDKAARVMTSPFRRPDPKSCHVEAKVTGHYTNSLIAIKDAKQKGFDEALLLDNHGFVAEATGANFFFQKGDKLYTAPRGNILPGITRSVVMDLAKENGITVEEKHFTPDDVYNADGAFFTGTAVEVNAIESLDDNKFKKEWHETFGHQLHQQFHEYARSNG
ncbi:MAG: branched-chain amino acid transaminase [Alcanivoracaceae bacterium]|nr:branched-chain amino acid transaminase [Alcanivoracaceae bacterium]